MQTVLVTLNLPIIMHNDSIIYKWILYVYARNFVVCMKNINIINILQEALNADILPDVEALLNSNKETVMKWL